LITQLSTIAAVERAGRDVAGEDEVGAADVVGSHVGADEGGDEGVGRGLGAGTGTAICLAAAPVVVAPDGWSSSWP
jgi:hypothetical protein